MFTKHIPILLLILLSLSSCKENPTAGTVTTTDTTKPGAAQVNYFLMLDSIAEIKQDSQNINNAKEYNGKLVTEPGVYKIGNEVLNLNEEGLYRVMIPFKVNYQVIVYKQDIYRLIGSITWLITHGNSDDKLTDDELIQKAKNDKIYITCEKACNFAKMLLTRYNVESRLIQGLALEEANGYDEGHVMLEFKSPQTGKWVLVDVDNNSFFKKKGSDDGFLNMVEFKDALASDELELVFTSRDKRVDISQFKSGDYSFSFYSESITASDETLIKWYKRIFNVALIGDNYYNATDTPFVKKYYPGSVYMSKDSFQRKYYN